MSTFSVFRLAASRLRQLLLPAPQMATPKRLLVVAAHPDDADAGCGATVAKLVRQGAQAYYLVATNGNKGDDAGRFRPEQLTDVRQCEQNAAASVIGARQVFFLGHDDGALVSDASLRAEVVRFIRQLKPDAVFTHDCSSFIRFDGGGINHADHRAIGQATIDACYPFARGVHQHPEQIAEGLSPHLVTELYLWGSLEPNHWEDVSATAQQKLEALRQHKTQFIDADAMSAQMLGYMRSAGQERGMRYAESFRRFVW